jgi:hypothetical protein
MPEPELLKTDVAKERGNNKTFALNSCRKKPHFLKITSDNVPTTCTYLKENSIIAKPNLQIN